ncbi:MAG: hypothetical protein ABIS18_10985 [Actinomycetota bacterium]
MAVAWGGRIRRSSTLLARIDADCSEDGPIWLLRLRPDVVFPTARGFIIKHKLRTLDAIHLAVAIEEGSRLAGADEIVFVTRDAAQSAAARSLGLRLE